MHVFVAIGLIAFAIWTVGGLIAWCSVMDELSSQRDIHTGRLVKFTTACGPLAIAFGLVALALIGVGKLVEMFDDFDWRGWLQPEKVEAVPEPAVCFPTEVPVVSVKAKSKSKSKK